MLIHAYVIVILSVRRQCVPPPTEPKPDRDGVPLFWRGTKLNRVVWKDLGETSPPGEGDLRRKMVVIDHPEGSTACVGTALRLSTAYLQK